MPDLALSAKRFYRRLVGRHPKRTPEVAPTAADGAAAVAAVESWIGSTRLEGCGAGGLATGLGLAAAGRRVSVRLSGAELTSSLALLSDAAGRRLPLVVQAAGAGVHEAAHAAAASGAVLFFATDVQDAVDLTLLARRLAEDALTPAVVAMDGVETELSVQDVRLPPPEALRRYLGLAGELIHPPTPSQEMVFGKHRRRVPRWHDPERPLLHGAALGSEVSGLSAAGRRLFFDGHVSELLAAAAEAFEGELGRRPEALRTHHVEGARLLLVAEGAAVEPAEAVTVALRAGGVSVGTVGVRVLRPFPASGLLDVLRGRRGVIVLEPSASAGLGEAPLATEIRALLGKEAPAVASAFYGADGAPLEAADLAALARRMSAADADWGAPVQLGFDAANGSRYPKRQALDDALRRAYPETVRLGVRGAAGEAGFLPDDALVVAVRRRAGQRGFSREAAALLHRLLGGSLRARSALDGAWGSAGVDLVIRSQSVLRDPGNRVPANVAVCCGPAGPGDVLGEVADGGAVLIRGGCPPALARAAEERGLAVYSAAGDGDERLLGALAGVLGLAGLADVSLRKLLQARRQTLEDEGEEEVDRRLDELQEGFERVRRAAPGGAPETAPPPSEPPAAVRRLGRSEAPLADLPGFWGRTGVFYRGGREEPSSPDPFLATRTVPPFSSALTGLSPARTMLPAFDPEPCTGCGACWTACPDSAVTPVVVAPSVLLDDGMRRAKAGGRSVDKLRMVASKLAAEAGRALAAEGRGGPAGPLFDAAFAAVAGKMKLPEEKKSEIREAWEAVRDEIAGLPVAATPAFADLFSLALDPDACKGCGLCVAVCEPEALSAAPDDAGRTAAARALASYYAELPPPDDATVEKARRSPDVGPLAGALLAREGRDAVAGGHGAEPGSGTALALRQVLGTAAYHLRPPRSRRLEAITELKTKLAGAIHGGLSQALPDRDLDALARGLDALHRPDADLAELTARVETAFETERVDVSRTRRLVDAARALADLEWRLTRGEGGLGSAPFGLVLAGDELAGLTAFPANPFRVPVTVDRSGDAAALALGLLEGQADAAVDAARAMRRARLELDRPQEAERAAAELGELSWDDLDDEERAGCAPVFLVTTERAFGRHTLASLEALHASNLPIRVVLLIDSATEDSSYSGLDRKQTLPKRTEPLFVQSSVAGFTHLESAVAASLAHPGASFLRVLAPSPSRGRFPADATLDRAREQVAAGAFPLISSAAGQAPPADPSPPAPESARPEASPEAIEALERQHAAEIAALGREHQARLAAERARYQAETAQRVRRRLMELATGSGVRRSGEEEARP